MSAIIFTGPTLRAVEARAVLDAEFMPPAAQGDVYRAALRRPQVIGLIDGYFERLPSVWHKEILWAMSRGIHVFGSASMGALRAAELAVFGMEGVGEVFAAFRDGSLEDDDEVAVAHAGEEFDFRPGSEAMVDIRRTLASAVTGGVLGAATGAGMESLAKAMFYPDRSYPALAARAVESGLPRIEVEGFLAWLPNGRFSQKRADALAMLEVIRERMESGLQPKRVSYRFENSSMWEEAWRLAGERYPVPEGGPQAVELDRLLDEVRLEGEPYLHAQQAAILRCLSIKHSYVQGLAEASALLASTERRFWERRGAGDAGGRQRWLAVNNLDPQQLQALLEDEARSAWIAELAAFEAAPYLVDLLRLNGEYPRLMSRAASKQSALEAAGLAEVGFAGAGLGRAALLQWYFEERLGRPQPEDLDAYSKTFGFDGREAFERALLREYSYLNPVAVTSADRE